MIRLAAGAGVGVELGCGRRKFDPSLVGVDVVELYDDDGAIVPDIIWNLERTPWPWAEDGSASFVLAHQTLEHIRNLIPLMGEVHRICDDDAWFEVVVPDWRSETAYQDPTHVRFFTPITFRYWEPGYVADFSDYGIRSHFARASVRTAGPQGNIYALLKPLKTPAHYAEFHRWRQTDKPAQAFPMTAPPELLARCDEHNLLGI